MLCTETPSNACCSLGDFTLLHDLLSEKSKNVDAQVQRVSSPLEALQSLSPSYSDTFYFDTSISANKRDIILISTYLANYLLSNIESLSNYSPHRDISPIKALTQQIYTLFIFIAQHAYFQSFEALHAVQLIQRLISSDKALKDSAIPKAIKPSTIGLVLICACTISMKCHRDHPIKNSWFARTFQIALKDFNASENSFLDRVAFNVTFTEPDLISIMRELRH